MRYMLDTNICIYCIKHKPENVIFRLKECDPADICISSITYSELLYGVYKSKQKERNFLALLLFLSQIKIVDFDSVAATSYGEIRANLESKGLVIGSLDMLIGAHAKALSLTIVTNNEKEFKRIDGLNVENWA